MLPEVDRSRIDDMEAVDKVAGVAIRIASGHVDKCLRDRERGTQFVGGIGWNLSVRPCVLGAPSIVSKASASSRNSSRGPGT